MNNTLYSDILNSCLSVLMGGLSVVIAIFTLTTAFIISKRDMLKDLEQQIDEGGVSLNLARRISATSTSISRMRKITNNSIIATAIFVVGLILYIIFCFLQPSWWIGLLTIITGIGIVYVLYIIALLFIWYRTTI